jgi:hypothetical protein
VGLFSWLASLFGGRRRAATPLTEEQLEAQAKQAAAEVRAARTRVVAYIRLVRNPIRLTTETRRDWMVELGKLYETIRNSPTPLVLDRAGDIGSRFQARFHDPLVTVQGLEPPPECEKLHHALVGWMTALEAACMALSDARRFKDRAQLGVFRERLGEARTVGAEANLERGTLIKEYKLLPPSIKRVGTGVALRSKARRRAMDDLIEREKVATSDAARASA